MQLVGVDVQKHCRQPTRKHERPSENLLLDRRKWPDRRAATQLLRDMRMLAEQQQILRDQRQEDAEADQSEQRAWTDEQQDRDVRAQEPETVKRKPAPVIRLLE